MRRITKILCSVAVLLLLAAPSLSPAVADDLGPVIDKEEDCLEAVPAAVSASGVTDTGQEISLDVLVLLDGVDLARGQEVMKKASEAYAPLKITLDVRFETVSFTPEVDGVGDNPVPASRSTRLLEDMKKWTFGARPADVDVVYLLTEKDLSDAAGRADCIGGVRYAEAAFAVGEDYRHEDLMGLFYKNGTAKIAAHEIGHLMGAHHHYANCAEGTPGAVEERGPTPCSLMFNFIDFLSLRFSVLEGAAVRGHAIEFASMGPDSQAIRSRSIALTIDGEKFRGTIDSSDPVCESKVEIRLQRYESEKSYEDQTWADIGTGRSSRKGTFKLRASLQPGQYRAFTAEQAVESKDGKVVCAQAASAPITVGS